MKFITSKQLFDEAGLRDLAEDKDVIRQRKASREDQQAGRVFDQDNGLEYLRKRIQEFECGQ